jgi:hypothetical protein
MILQYWIDVLMERVFFFFKKKKTLALMGMVTDGGRYLFTFSKHVMHINLLVVVKNGTI